MYTDMFSQERDALYYGGFTALLESHCLIGLLVILVTLIGLYKVFKKADVEGISAWIPIWHLWNLYKITWGSGWFMFFLLIPVLNAIFVIITNLKLSKAFGHGTMFGIGLCLFNPIFMCILGFSDSEYIGIEPEKL